MKQKWYTCEQCYRAWKLNNAEKILQQSATGQAATAAQKAAAASAATKAFLLCEPCITRCHAGHKGVRFMVETEASSHTYCMCMESSKITQLMCRACQISEKQMALQLEAENYRAEIRRERQRNLDHPPIFACVPRYNRRGQLKVRSGWMICRQCTPPSLVLAKKNIKALRRLQSGDDFDGVAEESIDLEDTQSLMIQNDRRNHIHSSTMDETPLTAGDDDESSSSDTDSDSDSSSDDSTDKDDDGSDKDENERGHSNKGGNAETKDANSVASGSSSSQQSKKNQQKKVEGEVIQPPLVGGRGQRRVPLARLMEKNNQDKKKKKKKKKKSKDQQDATQTEDGSGGEEMKSTRPKTSGVGDADESLGPAISIASSVVRHGQGLAENNRSDFGELGWIELFDAEEPEVLRYGDAVLCHRYSGYPRVYGRIKSSPKPGFYLVRYDVREDGEALLDRSRLELVSRTKFYFNTITGEASWNKLEDILHTIARNERMKQKQLELEQQQQQ